MSSGFRGRTLDRDEKLIVLNMPTPDRQIQNIGEIFPQENQRVGQFIGELRVIALNNGVTPEGIVDVLTEKGEIYLPIIACDENGGVPKLEDVLSDISKLEDLGIVQADREGRYSYTEYGRDLLMEHDRRVGAISD